MHTHIHIHITPPTHTNDIPAARLASASLCATQKASAASRPVVFFVLYVCGYVCVGGGLVCFYGLWVCGEWGGWGMCTIVVFCGM